MRGEPAELIRRVLSLGRTGRLVARDGATDVEHRVYVMQGEVLAAHTSRDGLVLARLLVNLGRVSREDAPALLAEMERRGSIEEVLIERIDEDTAIALLRGRFRQALLEFLALSGEARFEPMEAIFVENIQVGHDSHALVDELLQLWSRVRRLAVRDLTLRPGPWMPQGDRERQVHELCRPAGSLIEVLRWSPFEEGETLALVADMLDAGALVSDEGLDADASDPSLLAEDAVGRTPGWDREVLVATAEEPAEDWTADGFEVAPDGRVAPLTPGADRPEPESGDWAFDAVEERVPAGAAPGESAAEPAEPAAVAEAGAAPGEPAAEPAEPVLEALVESEPGPTVDDPDLAVFRDYEHVTRDGSFTVAPHLLDRVDLSEEALARERTVLDVAEEVPSPPDDEEEVIEVGDAEGAALGPEDRVVRLSFGPPPLDERAIAARIAVAGEVLERVAAALDEVVGPGAGAGAMQFVVDGAPARFVALLAGVRVDARGRPDAARVRDNLLRRPEAERRPLLDRGLLDLIERALSYALDELPEDRFERLLEEIAGYQQRMRE